MSRNAERYFRPVAVTQMHTDCTNAKVNGASAYVFICAFPDGKALYFARKKGARRCKGNAGGDILGILVHDHESTFSIMERTIRPVLPISSASSRTALKMKSDRM